MALPPWGVTCSLLWKLIRFFSILVAQRYNTPRSIFLSSIVLGTLWDANLSSAKKLSLYYWLPLLVYPPPPSWCLSISWFISVFLHRALRCLSLIFHDTNSESTVTTFSFISWNFYIKIFFGLRKSGCTCVCAHLHVHACVLHLNLKFSYSFGSSYLCQQLFLLWRLCCNPSLWLLGPIRELLFPCLFLRALSHIRVS